MKTQIQTITPEWAIQKLDQLQKSLDSKTFIQRPPRTRAIQRYAADMAAGKWLLTHQGIAFDIDGNLIDGQNRLWAVVKSKATVQMAVTTDVPGNGKLTAMDVTDMGMPRSMSNSLQISHGYTSSASEYSTLAKSCAGFLVMSDLLLAGDKPKNSLQISVQEALFILEDCNLIAPLERLQAIVPVKKMRHRAIIVSWCWYWITAPKKAEAFATSYATLENLKAKSPALLLMRYFTALTKRGRKSELVLISAAANAIQIYDSGTQVNDLRPSREALNWLARTNAKLGSKILDHINPKH